MPVKSLQIPMEAGGGPASDSAAGFHWGPSVSWNTHINQWVMLMDRALADAALPADVTSLLREFFHATATFMINRPPGG